MNYSRKFNYLNLFTCCIALFVFFLAGFVIIGDVEAGLISFVEQPDEVYDWEVRNRIEQSDGSTLFLIQLTSQKWQDYIFEHRLALIIPENVEKADFVGLMVAGGSLADRDDVIFDPDADEIDIISQVAHEVGTPMAVLFDVPYQPLFDNLREDALIAYTFDRYLETEDPDWPLLLPMTKTVIRAMDCLEEIGEMFYQTGNMEFLVFGGSKRGWTTWLTAAADSRVAGIGPAVYDNLELKKQMEHQLEVWGEYSVQISDYTRRGLQEELTTPAGQKLIELVDPYSYLDRITVPKLLMIGTNDPYWPLDALHLYYDELQGPVNLFYAPNAGHGIDTEEKILSAYGVFHYQTMQGLTLPRIEESFQKKNDDGYKLNVFSGQRAAARIKLWQADSPVRDFRDAHWEVAESTEKTGRTVFNIQAPGEGWRAVLVEVVFSEPVEFSLTTGVNIISPPE